MVERILGKNKVPGPIPGLGSVKAQFATQIVSKA